MRIFISYARQDQAAVEELNADLKRARAQVWMDEELIGNEDWWDSILEQIRSCELYIFALSPNSMKSRACKAELDYAIALSRPLLPVLIQDVAIQLAHPAIARTQMVDYRKRSMESVLALMAVVANRPPAPPLPDPLPAAPTIPMSYMNEFRELVDAPDLTYQKQAHLLLDLKGYLDSDEERDIALQLLRGLRQRRDISYLIAGEIDQLPEFANDEDQSPTGNGREPSKGPGRALSAIAGLLLILAGASFAWAGRTLPGSSGTQTADLAVAAGFVVLGAGLLLTRSRWRNTRWLATAGLCIGLVPFLSLRMLRSAELLSLRMSRRDEPDRGEELFGLWGPLALILLALVLIGYLLARNREVAFARPRVFGDPTATTIVFAVAAPIALAAIGVALLPTPRDNFTSGKFSDPMLLYFAVPLAIIAAVTQGILRAAVLAGWTAGSAGVLVTTIWFRQHPKNIHEDILNAHLLLSSLTVAILAIITVLAVFKSGSGILSRQHPPPGPA